jgi:hypothetical protein
MCAYVCVHLYEGKGFEYGFSRCIWAQVHTKHAMQVSLQDLCYGYLDRPILVTKYSREPVCVFPFIHVRVRQIRVLQELSALGEVVTTLRAMAQPKAKVWTKALAQCHRHR